jgi:hypothetical protein
VARKQQERRQPRDVVVEEATERRPSKWQERRKERAKKRQSIAQKYGTKTKF